MKPERGYNPGMLKMNLGDGRTIDAVVAFFGDGELAVGDGHLGNAHTICIASARGQHQPGDDISNADVDETGLGIMLAFKTRADVERFQGRLSDLLKKFSDAEAL